MSNEKLKKTIQAILFMSGRPMSIAEIAKSIDEKAEDVAECFESVKNDFLNTGITITSNDSTYQMATNPEVGKNLEKYLQSQLREKLSDSALETLSIICYKQPCTRLEIESIRGVNCQYALRLLSQRGLIEKALSVSGSKTAHYITTHEFLHHLGLQSIKDLPNFEEIVSKMQLPENMV